METTLYFGGPIVTLEEPRYAQALVERGGRIAYVGDREEAERLAGPGARRVDLEGRALLPAFLDPHSHLLACAYARLQVPLGECAGWGEIADRLSRHVQERGIQPGSRAPATTRMPWRRGRPPTASAWTGPVLTIRWSSSTPPATRGCSTHWPWSGWGR